MSDKKWNTTWAGHYRDKMKFPRHTMNKFEGTHCSMRKRYIHKSGVHSVPFGGRRGMCVPKKYIIGLLNKFIGKSYDTFLRVYLAKCKPIKNINFDEEGVISDLKWYLKNKPESNQWNDVFYVDDNGIIQKINHKPRHLKFPPKERFTQSQLNYNRRVTIPKLGRLIGIGISTKYLGKYWVYINNEICKLPVYCIPYSYRAVIPNGFIEIYVPEVPCRFDCWEYVDNYDYKWYQKRIGEISNEINAILAAKSANLSADICRLTDLEKDLQHMKLVIQSIPEKKWSNFGASIIKIVKQEDYDNQRRHKTVKKLSEQQRVRHHTK